MTTPSLADGAGMTLLDALAILATQNGQSNDERSSVIISTAYRFASDHAQAIKANYVLSEAEQERLTRLIGAIDD